MQEFSGAVAAVRERFVGSGGGGGGVGGGAAALSLPAPDVTIVLLSCDGAHVARHALSVLFPFPSPYHGVPHAHLATVGASFAGRAAAVTEASLAAALAAAAPQPLLAALLPAAAALHKAVAALAAAPHDGDELYPIHLAAGALLSDGTVRLARQLKGLEYGCSADAVVRLSGALGGDAAATVLVAQCDAQGNCIAPSAPARSLLSEHCRALSAEAVSVLVHGPGGELRLCSPSELAPMACEIVTG
jgi:hypothetical protein